MSDRKEQELREGESIQRDGVRRGSIVEFNFEQKRKEELMLSGPFSSLFVWYERKKLWFISRTRKTFLKIFTKRGKFTFRYRYMLRNIPLVNFFYDLFFDGSVVSPDSVKSLMDVLGLINALLLGAVASLFGSVDFEEMQAADALYDKDADTGYSRYWNKYYTQEPSQYAYLKISNTMIFLFIGIVVILFVYADSIRNTPGGEDEEDDGPVKVVMLQEKTDGSYLFSKNHWTDDEVASTLHLGDNPEIVVENKSAARKMTASQKEMEAYQLWFGYAKFTLILTFGTTLTAIVNAILAVLVIFAIKYPDYYIAERGDYDESDSDSMTGVCVNTFKTWFMGLLAITIIVCGLGTAAKYEREDDYRERDEFLDKLEGNLELDTDYSDEKLVSLVQGRSDKAEVIKVMVNFTRFLVTADLGEDNWNLAAKLMNVVILASEEGLQHPAVTVEKLNWHIEMATMNIERERNELKQMIDADAGIGIDAGGGEKAKRGCCGLGRSKKRNKVSFEKTPQIADDVSDVSTPETSDDEKEKEKEKEKA